MGYSQSGQCSCAFEVHQDSIHSLVINHLSENAPKLHRIMAKIEVTFSLEYKMSVRFVKLKCNS